MARGRRSVTEGMNTHEAGSVTDFTKTESDTGIAPWQRAGASVGDLSASAVLDKSGNNFKVKTVDAYQKVGELYLPVPDVKHIVREDSNLVLGTVGAKYRVIQNEQNIAAIHPLVESGFASYDTAGYVAGGRLGWAMLKLKDEITLPGNDKVLKYLMALWSHDGKLSLRIFPAPLRAFCANVLNTLLGQSEGGIAIRHTSTAEARIAEAARVIEASQGFYNTFSDAANKLLAAPVTDEGMKAMTEYLFPSREDENGDEVVSTRTKNIRESIMDLFVNGAGHDKGNMRGTAWAAYNAVAEYADHHRATRVGEDGDADEGRFAASVLPTGSGTALKAKAMKFIKANLLA